MFSPDQYELLDFGDGRRLERFGPWVLDRPCPAAEEVEKAAPAAWEEADGRFVRTEGKEGEWVSERPLPERWAITHGPVTLELKRTEFGHLGVFPEQAANWDWLAEQVRRVRETHQSAAPGDPPTLERRPAKNFPVSEGDSPILPAGKSGQSPAGKSGQSPSCSSAVPKVLNLFAYTGGSTLTAAASGADVVHVDAARNVVAWARRNAELSGLADAPIRWIAEDARKFVRRELKRGSRYDAVILDPPSYGHGPRGEVWRLSKHLSGLLAMCRQLAAGRLRFLLLTSHTPNFGPDRLGPLVTEALGQGRVTAGQLTLQAKSGRELPSGTVVRWEAEG
ncbi:MAG: class I SAM-dependent methyltransferase [Planctomycetota bacterium]